VCCSVLQCVAVCCSVLQCVAVCCSALQCVAVHINVASHDPYITTMDFSQTYTMTVCCSVIENTIVFHKAGPGHFNPQNRTLQHTATQCNTLQHPAIRCNTLYTLQNTSSWASPATASSVTVCFSWDRVWCVAGCEDCRASWWSRVTCGVMYWVKTLKQTCRGSKTRKTPDTWHMTHDTWHTRTRLCGSKTPDTWHTTHDTRHTQHTRHARHAD